jgi:hypothetical protein
VESPLFDASRTAQPSLILNNHEELLGVEGYFVDEIERVCGPWMYPVSGQDFNHVQYHAYLSSVKSLCTLSAAKKNGIYDTPQRRAEGFWRIPIGDIEQPSTLDLCRATSSAFEGYKKLWHDCVAEESVNGLSALAEAKALFDEGADDGSFGKWCNSFP